MRPIKQLAKEFVAKLEKEQKKEAGKSPAKEESKSSCLPMLPYATQTYTRLTGRSGAEILTIASHS